MTTLRSTAVDRLVAQRAADRSTARLDGTGNPFLCPALDQSLASPNDRHFQTSCLQQRIGSAFGIQPKLIGLLAETSSAIETIAATFTGPLIAVGTSTLGSYLRGAIREREFITIAGGIGRSAAATVELVADLPHDGVVVLDSPSDPLGSLTGLADVVRLARACQVVIIDERFAEFAGFTALPLVSEFDNVIVVRSFEHWVGDSAPRIGWAACPAPLVEQLSVVVKAPAGEAVSASLAALSDMQSVRASFRRVREERSRLFRMLRKFSFLTPAPSWGPFVSARVELVSRDALTAALASRSVRVHAPTEKGLERYVRIGIGAHSEMDRLRAALIDAAPELIGGMSA